MLTLLRLWDLLQAVVLSYVLSWCRPSQGFGFGFGIDFENANLTKALGFSLVLTHVGFKILARYITSAQSNM
jgi:hypothetical protein